MRPWNNIPAPGWATMTEDPLAVARLTERVGPVVFEMSMGELTGGYLAEFDHLYCQVRLTPNEAREYEREYRVFQDFFRQYRAQARGLAPFSDFTRFAVRSSEGRRALQCQRRAQKLVAYPESKQQLLENILGENHGRKTLLFTADTESALAIAWRYCVMPITSAIGRKERERWLAKFKAGEIRTLVTCRVLNEGVDVPDAEVAVIVGAAMGGREHVQRIGRCLRPIPGKRATVIELICAGTHEVKKSERRNRQLGL